MKKQPEALRLAEVAPYLEGGERGQWIISAAAELRRLHESNTELLAALKWAMNRIDKKARHEAIEGNGELYAFVAAMGAIAKAEGEMK